MAVWAVGAAVAAVVNLGELGLGHGRCKKVAVWFMLRLPLAKDLHKRLSLSSWELNSSPVVFKFKQVFLKS